MSDTTTVWNVALGRGDWSLAGASLQTGNDLETAVLISLFTDRRANPTDIIPDGTGDRRGWWGDLDAETPIGSRLWLLDRSTLSQQTALDAQDYALEALQWLIDDGVAATVIATATIVAPKRLDLAVTITDAAGGTYSWAWQGI